MTEEVEFTEVQSGTTHARNVARYLDKAWLKLTNYALYFGEHTLDNLGEPKFVRLEVDTKNKMVKLSPAVDRRSGWTVTPTKPKATSTIRQYKISPTVHPEVRKLPRGFYSPTGGEIYAYKEEFNKGKM